MSCDKYQDMLMAYLDDELSGHERYELEEHLADCASCTSELEDFKRLKSITENIRLFQPEEKIFREYWSSIYNRIERSIGWILLSVCGMVLIFYAGYKMVEEIVKDPDVAIIFKIAMLGFIAAIAILLVSVLREKLNFRKKDRYKDVRK